MLDLGSCLRYYKRPEIQKAIVEAAKDKEVSTRFPDEGFGKRPDILVNPSDVIENVKQNVSSFHCSEELWHNPLQIATGMRKDELSRLRKGWDLVLDIDCPYWELSKITTWLFIQALKNHGVKSISLKFSGNKGFHIGVPFKAFPGQVPGKDVLTKDYFPEGPRRIAEYLLSYIEKNLIKVSDNEIIFNNKTKLTFDQLKQMTGKSIEELTHKISKQGGREIRMREVKENTSKKHYFQCSNCGNSETFDEPQSIALCKKCKSIMQELSAGKTKKENANYERRFNPLSVVSVDTVLIAPRHLYRMVYSLHEKSGLASIPIDPARILEFEKAEAKPEQITVKSIVFLDDSRTVQGEATHLLREAIDFNPEILNEEEKQIRKSFATYTEEITQKIPEELFPPCIKALLQGVKSDGRKRAMFMLINFLSSVGWNHDEIKERLDVWNKVNYEPLRETLLHTHLNYHTQQNKKVLPPNCPKRVDNIPIIQQNYYTDLQVCHPDNLCATIKNPVQYAKKRAWLVNREVSQRKGRKKTKKDVPNTVSG